MTQKSDTSVEEKLSEAARLIKEAGLQLEDVGLEIDFTITIKAQPPTFTLYPLTEPGENAPPSK